MFFKKKQRPSASVLISSQFTNVAAGTREFNFWRSVMIKQIFWSSSQNAGIFTIGFRTFDTDNSPYLQTAPASTYLNRIDIFSSDFGSNQIVLTEPIVTDYMSIVYPAHGSTVYTQFTFEVLNPYGDSN
jgi:hypothetical protein